MQYILHTIESALPALLEFGILAPSPPSLNPSSPTSVGAIEALREQLNSLAVRLLPEMIGLVDAFGFSDWELDSAVSREIEQELFAELIVFLDLQVGRYGGQPYETMLARAKNDLDANVGNAEARKRM